jgi:aspartyl protease family protein
MTSGSIYGLYKGKHMGIQDRDYYWEKHSQKPKKYDRSALYGRSSNVVKIRKKSSSNAKFLIYPALSLFIAWYAFDAYLKHRNSISAIPAIAAFRPNNPVIIPGGVALTRDRQGHFRGTVLINNVKMPFMIDTGATRTSIPRNMAIKAGLPFGRIVQTNTANGKNLSHETRINDLKLGNVTIKNIKANINDHLDEVLIGMNTLKYFRMVQNNNTLTLVTNGYRGEIMKEPVPYANQTINQPVRQALRPGNALLRDEQVPSRHRLVKRPTIIRKRTTCSVQNGHKSCVTSYSDH